MQPGAPAISVQGLAKVLGGRKVIEDFSIDVPAGHIFGFLGPNGSGKTTTIRMLCGLLTPDAGSGRCLGYDIIEQSAAIKREVGYMPQRFGLYEDLSIRENLDFVARLYGVPEPRRRVEETLERLGLVERARQLAGHLSGGWKQRLALAACLLHTPRLLLLDEPTAGVDPKARREFWDQIHDLAAARHDRAGQHALHGRGRALPPGRLSRRRQAADPRRRRRGARQVGAHHVRGRGAGAGGAGRQAARPARRRDDRGVRRQPARQRHRSRRCSSAASRPSAPTRRLRWARARPSLEDVFIHTLARAGVTMS